MWITLLWNFRNPLTCTYLLTGNSCSTHTQNGKTLDRNKSFLTQSRRRLNCKRNYLKYCHSCQRQIPCRKSDKNRTIKSENLPFHSEPREQRGRTLGQWNVQSRNPWPSLLSPQCHAPQKPCEASLPLPPSSGCVRITLSPVGQRQLIIWIYYDQ